MHNRRQVCITLFMVTVVWVMMCRSKMSAVCVAELPGHWLYCSIACCCGIDWQMYIQFCWCLIVWEADEPLRWTTQFHWLRYLYFQADCGLHIQLRISVLVVAYWAALLVRDLADLSKSAWKFVCVRQPCWHEDLCVCQAALFFETGTWSWDHIFCCCKDRL